jgi:hypothetical protein
VHVLDVDATQLARWVAEEARVPKGILFLYARILERPALSKGVARERIG